MAQDRSGRYLSLGGAVAAMLLLAGCAAEPFPTLSYAERPCYRTLADVDCHDGVLVGEESRRVGFYDPPLAPPVAAGQEETWPLRLF
ncbi:MAG: hypothetical protein Tsb0032_15560 [Kiloniellaceae bacterium]